MKKKTMKKKTIIPVNDEYRITADMSWQVEKYTGTSKKTGKENWVPKTYHPNIDSAIKSLSQRLLRESGAQTPQELVNAARMIRQEFESVGFKLAV